ncbi:hypothetical protein [Bradyrhizobium lablabi]|uniref:hypothetical protein n=1 Tax=Bradyrhizobium lablabi TaxID=722472 RepID=UPI001BAD4530|nr:hypothetical protein [Bradyrhizobium lablabi]MBR0693650.1 hypothetical protein [Bradyrhizobium lablabi]
MLNYLYALLTLNSRVTTLERTYKDMANELDDLTAAVATMQAAVTSAAAEMKAEADKILAAVSSPAGIDPAAVEQAAVSIKGLADQLNSATTAAHDQVNPTAPQG